jgi:hypothetical protein
MANLKLTLESEWAKETLKEISSLLQPDRAGDLPPEISDRLSQFLKSPGDMFIFDSQPCAGGDGERRILLKPSDSLLHFMHALRKWNRIGWDSRHIIVFDLQTCEGAAFRPGGNAHYDLDKHQIWVRPLFEPFLEWLYKQPQLNDLTALPDCIDLADAPFAMAGYRRNGPGKA